MPCLNDECSTMVVPSWRKDQVDEVLLQIFYRHFCTDFPAQSIGFVLLPYPSFVPHNLSVRSAISFVMRHLSHPKRTPTWQQRDSYSAVSLTVKVIVYSPRESLLPDSVSPDLMLSLD
jgi:hypothetical protein